MSGGADAARGTGGATSSAAAPLPGSPLSSGTAVPVTGEVANTHPGGPAPGGDPILGGAPAPNLSTPSEVFGGFRLRAVGGGPLRGAWIFRSCELARISGEEAAFLVNDLNIGAVYDIRNQWEVAAHPEPYLMGAKTVALEPSTERRRKDAQSRLVAGVIGEYGKPEERMRLNYRRYVREYPLIGAALRSLASERRAALVHCVNGKDRTGVLCAVLLRASGAHADDVMADYLATNAANAERIAQEAARLGAGMTDGEREILLSFLEARPSYLQAFFDEVDALYGSFERYVRDGLRLTDAQRGSLAALLAR